MIVCCIGFRMFITVFNGYPIPWVVLAKPRVCVRTGDGIIPLLLNTGFVYEPLRLSRRQKSRTGDSVAQILWD